MEKREKNRRPAPRSLGDRWITVIGAREHNLKNITVAIPKEKLTIITGPSGSGKSSLALDILFTEGKRRYMESLSSYARQFLGIAKKPDVDQIDGLCPSIAIEQKTVGHNPRSTVGTITEIYDYLRVLFARIGQPHCPDCQIPIRQESPEKISALVMKTFSQKEITIAATIAIEKKGSFFSELIDFIKQGYYRFTIDGQFWTLRNEADVNKLKIKKTLRHSIDVLLDRCIVTSEEKSRLGESIEKAFALGGGLCKIIHEDHERLYSSRSMCVTCGFSCGEIEPRIFSFNSPLGACKRCGGLGVEYQWSNAHRPSLREEQADTDFDEHEITCRSCNGMRLNPLALSVKIAGKNIFQVSELSIKNSQIFFEKLQLTVKEAEIAKATVKEIKNRLLFLKNVGLDYLSLNRTSRTLSGGEGQRIRLATQIGSALSGVLYILDEPSIGLHQRDNDRLIATLKSLRDQGNTVVVVEHDADTMEQADYIIDIGPAAGVLGGHIVAVGTPAEIKQDKNSITGAYLNKSRSIERHHAIRKPTGFIKLRHLTTHNLKNIDVKIPLGVLCGVSGVSGSGKSTLVMNELARRLEQYFAVQALCKKQRVLQLTSKLIEDVVGDDDMLTGAQSLDAMVLIDQSPIGRTPRSNPATYLGIFNGIRDLYCQLPESKVRGYKAGRFSFNVYEGRCAECNGDGSITVSMHFLPDVTMVCPMCGGKRYNKQTLEIAYKGKNIADVLEMTALEAREFFASYPTISKRLDLLCEVGLDYLKLGQPSTTLSGGEAQRIKLVNELAKRGHNTMYILDEPTTGLHNSDIEKLLLVLNKLVDKGNSMVIIEHNLDVLKTVDYLIDMGPEGGDEGGQVIASGTPEEVSAVVESHTGKYLKKIL